ncbi:hypothetical protein H0H87_009381 [Tephrocybe sp. NHM501043]|nr:hypothetical protein H0H87_009381 [Tephrocybe sp. NHM501043]
MAAPGATMGGVVHNCGTHKDVLNATNSWHSGLFGVDGVLEGVELGRVLKRGAEDGRKVMGGDITDEDVLGSRPEEVGLINLDNVAEEEEEEEQEDIEDEIAGMVWDKVPNKDKIAEQLQSTLHNRKQC